MQFPGKRDCTRGVCSWLSAAASTHQMDPFLYPGNLCTESCMRNESKTRVIPGFTFNDLVFARFCLVAGDDDDDHNNNHRPGLVIILFGERSSIYQHCKILRIVETCFVYNAQLCAFLSLLRACRPEELRCLFPDELLTKKYNVELNFWLCFGELLLLEIIIMTML